MSKLSDFNIINDAVVRESTTWSSTRLTQEFDSIRTNPPTVSTESVTLTEGNSTTVEITDYSTELTYTVDAVSPDVATISRNGSTLTITAEPVDSTQTVTVRVNADVIGFLPSSWTNISVTVEAIPIVSDTAIFINDFSGEALFNDGWDQV